MSEQTNMVTIQLNSVIDVTGARGKEFKLDLGKGNREAIEGLIGYAFGVIVQRASASVDGFDKKVKAEADKAQELLDWKWQPGKRGGGGSRLDERGIAERNVLTTLFLSMGLKKGDAEKRAKGKTAWKDFTLLSMSKGKGKDELPTEAEVVARLESKQSQITAAIDKEVEAERKRKADLETSLDFS